MGRQQKIAANMRRGPSAGRFLSLCQLGLRGRLAKRRQEERLVDPTLEYRHPKLHALRDYLTPVHASFARELRGGQMNRHRVRSPPPVFGNRPTTYRARRTVETLLCKFRPLAHLSGSFAPQKLRSCSNGVRYGHEVVLHVEPLGHELAQPPYAEGLRGP